MGVEATKYGKQVLIRRVYNHIWYVYTVHVLPYLVPVPRDGYNYTVTLGTGTGKVPVPVRCGTWYRYRIPIITYRY